MSTPNLARNGDAVTPRPVESTGVRRNPLWWIVLAAFAIQLAAWAVWFTIAARHPVAEVPLETKGTR